MVKLEIDLPPSFFAEEEIYGFRVETWRKEVWAVELDLLVALSKVCEKHRLPYFLGGGTLLGAALYKGFVPWDDDIDVYMPREDYEKLCAVASDEFKEPHFFQTWRSEPGYPKLHAQLRFNGTTGIQPDNTARGWRFNQSIFIDVFPLDAVPEDDEERMKFNEEVRSAVRGLRKSPLRDVPAMASSADHLIQRYRKSDGCPRLVNSSLSTGVAADRDIFEADWIREADTMTFCGRHFPVPIGWKPWLCQRYPRWNFQKRWRSNMRGSCHGVVIFDANRSWQDVLRENPHLRKIPVSHRIGAWAQRGLLAISRFAKRHPLAASIVFFLLAISWTAIVVLVTRLALGR